MKGNSENKRMRLTAADQRVLDELRRLPSNAVSRCANLIHDHNFSAHRGTTQIGRYKLIFGNDGFTPQDGSDDQRSRVEVVRVVKAIQRINDYWKSPLMKITGFGLSSDGGYTWAMRVETLHFAWADVLDTAVWDAWFRACGGGKTWHPFPNRLRQEIRRMSIVRSRAA